MLQRWAAVAHPMRSLGNGDRLRPDSRSAPALHAHVIDVRGEAVADVDHGMYVGCGEKLERLADTRSEFEVFAEDAAAEGPSHQKAVADSGAASTDRPARRRFSEDRDGNDEWSI